MVVLILFFRHQIVFSMIIICTHIHLLQQSYPRSHIESSTNDEIWSLKIQHKKYMLKAIFPSSFLASLTRVFEGESTAILKEKSQKERNRVTDFCASYVDAFLTVCWMMRTCEIHLEVINSKE